MAINIKEILKNPDFKKIAVIILLLVIADTFFIVSIKSLWTKNSGLTREVKNKTWQLKMDQDKLSPEDSLTREVQTLRAQASSLESKLFSEGGDILAYLNQFTKDSQIRFKGIYPSDAIPLEVPQATDKKDSPQPKKNQKKPETSHKKEPKEKKPRADIPAQKLKSWEAPALTQLPVRIVMECDYQQLLQFLDMVENGPRLIMVSDIKIENNPQDVWSQNVELFLKIPTMPPAKNKNE